LFILSLPYSIESIMSAINTASDSAYSSIADNHLYLNIAGAGPNEYEFYSGYKGRPMIKWSEWMDYVLFGNKPIDPESGEKALVQAISRQEKGLPSNAPVRNPEYSVYDIISMDPRLSKMKKLIDYVGYPKIGESGITLLVPVNDMFDQIISTYHPLAFTTFQKLDNADKANPPNSKVTKMPNDQSLPWAGLERPAWQSLLQIMRYHILPYTIDPWQLEGRKLKLRTDLDLQFIKTDWTKYNRPLFINPISTRIIPGAAGELIYPVGNPLPNLPDVWFPKTEWEVACLGVIKCVNGYVYIIDRPLVFQNVL
jgi:hypothetical protein